MVSDFTMMVKNNDELKTDILPEKAREAFLAISKTSLLPCSKWYLAGGTSLALQVGHRQSVDLDFFTPGKSFLALSLERKLFNTGHWTTKYQENGTIYGEMLGAKMSLIAYPFFKPAASYIHYGKICLLRHYDIAAMKIIAISQRGRKRDFVDLYWYCSNIEKLLSVIERSLKQYPGHRHNLQHILKSLVYFEDAESDPMPVLFFHASWKMIKAYFKKEVSEITKQLLKLK